MEQQLINDEEIDCWDDCPYVERKNHHIAICHFKGKFQASCPPEYWFDNYTDCFLIKRKKEKIKLKGGKN